MIDNLAVLLALRARLLSLQFAGTGVTTLAATGTGYTRGAGSFVTDGFVPGMEVVPDGFADNTPGIIKSVTAVEIVLRAARPAEISSPGRSLTVGVPLIRGWENVQVTRLDERWDIEEDYLPGPSSQVTVGINGQLEHTPMYVLRVSGIAGIGVTALYKVADGILAGFPPRLAMAMSDGYPLRVRSDVAPYRGQALPGEDPGRTTVVITIPLTKRTDNPI